MGIKAIAWIKFWNRIIIEHNRLKPKYDNNGEVAALNSDH